MSAIVRLLRELVAEAARRRVAQQPLDRAVRAGRSGAEAVAELVGLGVAERLDAHAGFALGLVTPVVRDDALSSISTVARRSPTSRGSVQLEPPSGEQPI